MNEYSMEARVRKNTNKGYKRMLSQKKMVPAILYGKKIGSLPLEVARNQVEDAILSGKNTIINLTVKGNGGVRRAILKEVQRQPLNRDLVHADFQEISLREKIHARVPLVLVKEVSAGTPYLVSREIEIHCLPSRIPEHILVDLTGKKPGDAIFVNDLVVPGGVEVVTAGDTRVLVIADDEKPPVEAPPMEKETATPGEKTAT